MPESRTLDAPTSDKVAFPAQPEPVSAPEHKPRSGSVKKIIIAIAVIVVLAALVALSVHSSQSNVTAVTTGKVVREDISAVVTGSGEIKPKTETNLGAQGFGKITKLYVKEGDTVKKGQLLVQLENVQPEADVNAQRASIETSQMDL